MSESLSIYIPRVLKSHTTDSVGNILCNAGIGLVRRVDFVSVECDKYMAAFVHLQSTYHTPIAYEVCAKLEYKQEYKFTINSREFWILLKANNVIPETRLNMHQLAENHRLLEDVVVKQEEEISRMKDDITRLQDTIYQILRKAFNNETEKEAINANFNWMKLGKRYNGRAGDEGEYAVYNISSDEDMPSLNFSDEESSPL